MLPTKKSGGVNRPRKKEAERDPIQTKQGMLGGERAMLLGTREGHKAPAGLPTMGGRRLPGGVSLLGQEEGPKKEGRCLLHRTTQHGRKKDRKGKALKIGGRESYLYRQRTTPYLRSDGNRGHVGDGRGARHPFRKSGESLLGGGGGVG